MNTEQLKQAAMAAPKSNWASFILDKPLNDVPSYVDECIKASPGADFYFVMGRHPDGGEADICHVGNGPSAAALSAYIAAANPATIMALLECVDALRLVMDDEQQIGDIDTPEAAHEIMERCRKARAALQKLEAL